MNFKSQQIILNESASRIVIQVPRIIQTLPNQASGDMRIDDYAYGYSLRVKFDPSDLVKMEQLALHINGVPLVFDDDGRVVSSHILYPTLSDNFFLVTMRGKSANVSFRLLTELIVTIGKSNPFERVDKLQGTHTISSLSQQAQDVTIRYTPNYYLGKEEDLTTLFNDELIAKAYSFHVRAHESRSVVSQGDRIAPYYGYSFQSAMLLRTNPKLTGNIKLAIDSQGKISLDTFPVNPLLGSRRYSSNPVSGMGVYGDDVRRLFSLMPKGVFYDEPSSETAKDRTADTGGLDMTYMYGGTTNVNPTHKEGFVFLAPLYLKEKLPDFFAVFSVPTKDLGLIDNQSGNIASFLIENGRLVSSWSMKQGTLLGDYLRRHYSEAIRYPSPYLLQPSVEDGENVFRGVSVRSGLFTSATELNYHAFTGAKKSEYPTETYNKFISGAYERNELVHPHIINMEYYFDDNEVETLSLNTYFGLYLTEEEIVKYDMITLMPNGDARCYKGNDGEYKDNDLFLHAKEMKDKRIIYGLSSGRNLLRVRNEKDLKKAITSGSLLKNNDVKATFRISSIPEENEGEFLTMSLEEPYTEGSHFRILFSREGEYNRRVVSDTIVETDKAPVVVDIAVVKKKYKDGVSHVLRTEMTANGVRQRLLATLSAKSEKDHIDANAIYYKIHKDDVSFITNERLVNDNHHDGHVFRYYSGLGGQRSEDYVGGLKVTHTPFKNKYIVPSDIPNMFVYKEKINLGKRRKMRDNVILPFSPEDDLTSVTPIVYHVSITETGDVETFIKRIKLALRMVMEEQNDVSFQVKDNGVTRLDIFTKHKATYAQIIYPKGNTIGFIHTFFGREKFAPKVELYKDSVNASIQDRLFFFREDKKVASILGNSDFQNMGDMYHQCVGFMPISDDMVEVYESPERINELVSLGGWVSVCNGTIAPSKDFVISNISQDIREDKALRSDGEYVDIELARLSFNETKVKAIISPFGVGRSVVYNGNNDCHKSKYVKFYGNDPVQLSRMAVHPFHDLATSSYETIRQATARSPFVYNFSSSEKLNPSVDLNDCRIYKIISGGINGISVDKFSTYPPSVFEYVKTDLERSNIPNYYNIELTFSSDTQVVEVDLDTNPLDVEPAQVLSPAFRDGYIKSMEDKLPLLTSSDFLFRNIGIHEENAGLVGSYGATQNPTKIPSVDTSLLVEVDGVRMSIYNYIDRYGDTSIFDRVFDRAIDYTHGVYQPNSETLQFFIDNSLATISVKGNLKSKIPLSELSRCSVAVLGVSTPLAYPEVIIDRFLGRVYILTSLTGTSAVMGTSYVYGDKDWRRVATSSYSINPSKRISIDSHFDGDSSEGTDIYGYSGSFRKSSYLIQEWNNGFLSIPTDRVKVSNGVFSVPSSVIPSAMLKSRGSSFTEPTMSYFSVGNIGQLVSSMVVSGETQASLSVSEILNLIKSSPMRISIRNKEHKETYLTSGDDFTIGIERLPVGSALSRSLGHYDVCTLPMFKYGSMVGGGFVVRSVGSATAFRLNGDNVERVTDLNVLSTSPINNGSIKTTLSTKKMMSSDGFAIKGKDGITILVDKWTIGDDLTFDISTSQSEGKQVDNLRIECNITKGAFNALRRNEIFSSEIGWITSEEERNRYINSFITKYLSLKDNLSVSVFSRVRSVTDTPDVLFTEQVEGMEQMKNVSTSIAEVNNNLIYYIDIKDIDDRKFFVSVGISSIIG